MGRQGILRRYEDFKADSEQELQKQKNNFVIESANKIKPESHVSFVVLKRIEEGPKCQKKSSV